MMKTSQTNWEKVKNIKDDDIDYSDLPEVSMEMFAKGIVRSGLKPPTQKLQITLRIDEDGLNFTENKVAAIRRRLMLCFGRM
jgi:hypothetical protein